MILLNENGEKIPDAKITVQGNSYTIHAGEFLEGPESGQKYTVEYQVAITDESVIGKEIENEVVVEAENAEETKRPGDGKSRRTDTGRTNTGRADTRRTDTGRAESGRAESGRTEDACYTCSYIGENH